MTKRCLVDAQSINIFIRLRQSPSLRRRKLSATLIRSQIKLEVELLRMALSLICTGDEMLEGTCVARVVEVNIGEGSSALPTVFALELRRRSRVLVLRGEGLEAAQGLYPSLMIFSVLLCPSELRLPLGHVFLLEVRRSIVHDDRLFFIIFVILGLS